jgi:hypothetical protein
MVVIGEDGPCEQGPTGFRGGVEEHGGDDVEVFRGVEEALAA